MGTFDYLDTYFVFKERVSDATIRSAFEYCLETGCSTRPDGTTDRCQYRAKSTDYHQETVETETAITDLAEERSGQIEIWYKEVGFNFSVNESEDPTDSTVLRFIVDSVYFKEGTTIGSGVRPSVNAMIELACRLHVHESPTHTYSEHHGGLDVQKELSLERLRTELPAYIGWLTIFSPDSVQRFGRDTLREISNWRNEELNDGSFMLVLAESPYDLGDVQYGIQVARNSLRENADGGLDS